MHGAVFDPDCYDRIKGLARFLRVASLRSNHTVLPMYIFKVWIRCPLQRSLSLFQFRQMATFVFAHACRGVMWILTGFSFCCPRLLSFFFPVVPTGPQVYVSLRR